MKFWKKENELLGSPLETMGFSKEKNYIQTSSVMQKFLIKLCDLSSVEQVPSIKKQLANRKILIINAKDLLESAKLSIEELTKAIEEIKVYLKETGGSIGRIGDQYLILTPNAQVKISN